MSRRSTAVAVVLTLLGAVLRMLWLESNPNGFFCDEASTGYDAYSILHTDWVSPSASPPRARAFPVRDAGCPEA